MSYYGGGHVQGYLAMSASSEAAAAHKEAKETKERVEEVIAWLAHDGPEPRTTEQIQADRDAERDRRHAAWSPTSAAGGEPSRDA